MLLKQSLITAAQPDLDILSPQNIAGSPRLCPPASGRGLRVPINIAAVVSGLLLLSRKPLTGQISIEKYIIQKFDNFHYVFEKVSEKTRNEFEHPAYPSVVNDYTNCQWDQLRLGLSIFCALKLMQWSTS